MSGPGHFEHGLRHFHGSSRAGRNLHPKAFLKLAMSANYFKYFRRSGEMYVSLKSNYIESRAKCHAPSLTLGIRSLLASTGWKDLIGSYVVLGKIG